MAKHYRNSLVPGFALILIGGYLIARRMHWPLPRFDQLYPIFFLLLGAISAIRIRGRGHREGVFGAVFFVIIGTFYLLYNYGVIPFAFEDWPIWPLAAGLGFLVSWLFVPNQWALLIPGTILSLVGIGFLLPEFGLYYDFDVERYWPVLIIAAGIVVLVGGIRKST